MNDLKIQEEERMKKVSVILIAKKEEELKQVVAELEKQDYPNFEIVTSYGHSIPKDWNKAIEKASGDILIFTESDARPLHKTWISEFVKELKPNEILKGAEIRNTPMNMCCTAVYADVAKKFKFDESMVYGCGEDTEWFIKLRRAGVKERRFWGAFVHHNRIDYDYFKWKQHGRAKIFGMNWAKQSLDYENYPILRLIQRHVLAVDQNLLVLKGMEEELEKRGELVLLDILRKNRQEVLK